MTSLETDLLMWRQYDLRTYDGNKPNHDCKNLPTLGDLVVTDPEVMSVEVPTPLLFAGVGATTIVFHRIVFVHYEIPVPISDHSRSLFVSSPLTFPVC